MEHSTTTATSHSAFDKSMISKRTADSLRLAMLPGIGPRTMSLLLEAFGEPAAVLAAADDQLASIHGVGKKLIQSIRTADQLVDVESIARWCHRNHVDILCQDADSQTSAIETDGPYPRSLADLPDAPPILFVQGDLVAEDELAVAIVGTRHATTYGLKQAEHLAYSLARAGVTVISGLARGIDAAAHEGALAGGGRTIAVLGSGHDHIYPREHEGLAKAVAADGAVISECPPYAKPRAGMFPQRNRIIAGLSLATLVIEAPDRSGALITARIAMEQNREVLAVPGPITSRVSRGCNQLIRDGAKLIQNVDDILEELGPMRAPVQTSDGHEVRNAAELQLNELERAVLNSIETESTPIDQVIHRSQLPAHSVIAVISVLEMRRLVRRLSGQCVVRI
ncbi:MAG: DNA-processing protein DprA [Rubripirellula sp.]